MGVVFDISILIALEREDLDPQRLIKGQEDEVFGLSVITASELLHGVQRADTSKRWLKRNAYVERILEEFSIFPFDLAASRVYAGLWATLQKKRGKIGDHDLMIGATAISKGFSVATFELRDFGKIDGLTLQHFGS